MARRNPHTTKAEAAGQTRRALLEAGAQLLHDQPVGSILNQVKANEVARRAGRTIGAFYHHWPDQESYQRDLVEHVLSPERLPSTAAAAQSVLSDLDDEVLMEEIVRRGGRANFDALRDNPFVPLFMALWSKQGTDEHIHEQLRRHYRTITDQLVPIYSAFFDSQGWEPRPPFTMETFAATLTALAEGLTVRAAVDPDAVPLDLPPTQSAAKVPLDGNLDQGSWDLFSIVVLALIPSMTVPKTKRDSDLWLDHEDVRGLVRRLRETWETMVRNPTTESTVDA
jgi:AcrR family transcriptional regulator